MALPPWPSIKDLIPTLPQITAPDPNVVIRFKLVDKKNDPGIQCPDYEQLQLLIAYLKIPQKDSLYINNRKCNSISIKFGRVEQKHTCLMFYARALIMHHVTDSIVQIQENIKKDFPGTLSTSQYLHTCVRLGHITQLLLDAQALQCDCALRQHIPFIMDTIPCLQILPEILYMYFMYFKCNLAGDSLVDYTNVDRKNLAGSFDVFNDSIMHKQRFQLKRIVLGTLVDACNRYIVTAKHKGNERTKEWVDTLLAAATPRFFIYHCLVRLSAEKQLAQSASPSIEMCFNLLLLLTGGACTTWAPPKTKCDLDYVRYALVTALVTIVGDTVYGNHNNVDLMIAECATKYKEETAKNPNIACTPNYILPNSNLFRISLFLENDIAFILNRCLVLRLQ